MAEETEPKWEGKASVEIASLKAEQVWACLEDFCNFHKWCPNLDTCYQVEGVPGQPGLVRYSASGKTLFPGSDEKDNTITWSKEKLLMIDPIRRCYSYEFVDNNFGFKSYVANIKVLPIDGGDGCKIEWSFVADPIEGWRLEDLVSIVHYSLKFMAKKMEHVLLP